jgi:hypothetical protein
MGEKEAGKAPDIGLAAVYKPNKLPFANPARERGAMLGECFEWNLNRGKELGFWTIPIGCWYLLTYGPCRGPHIESTRYIHWTVNNV